MEIFKGIRTIVICVMGMLLLWALTGYIDYLSQSILVGIILVLFTLPSSLMIVPVAYLFSETDFVIPDFLLLSVFCFLFYLQWFLFPNWLMKRKQEKQKDQRSPRERRGDQSVAEYLKERALKN